MSQVDLQVRSRSRAAGLLLCAVLLTAPLVAPLVAQPAPELPADSTAGAPVPTAAAVRLQPAIVPAAGRQAALLEVADFGRYSIRVTSARGTALQVLDRMSGAGEIAGEAGKQDGRIDLFLDRGAVRVLTFGSKLATGEASLEALPFRERSADAEAGPAGAAIQLVEGKAIDGELADLEQRSWWIEIPKRRRVVFEAAGRNLADLRLWQGGSWLVDAAPTMSVVEPQSGRPLQLCQLTADLAPGLYRLTAYGGPEVRWSASGVERPFHLRFGWPRDAQTLRERRTIGPLGFERVLVSGAADYFRLELPAAPRMESGVEASVDLELVTLDENDPFGTGGPSTSITKENVPPVGEIQTVGDPNAQIVVTVRGVAGQPYVLQHFARTRERELNARAVQSEYWISTVHAGPVADAIEPTAILVRKGDGAKKRGEVIASETVVLSNVAGWARRFNLLDAATLYVKVEQAGTYRLQSRGTAAQFRLEPLFIDAYPEGWQTPPMRSAPAEWQLDPGYYVLLLQPVEAGIAEIELAAQGAPPVAIAPPRPSVQLGVMQLSAKLGYHLYVSQQPGVEAGLVVRELPLDLAAALPLALGPGEEVELRMRAAEASSVRALTEDGGGLELSLDGAPWAGAALGAPESFVAKGEHRLRVRSTSDATVLASVGLVPASQLATTPLPPLPEAALAALPDFPRLAVTSPQTLDLATGEARTFLVAADEPALYRLESTGLLATGGALRTRTRADLLSQAENGVGRNFALAAYLREGDYQLTVRARGASAGHLGVELARAPIADAGALTEGVPARATIDPRTALAYRWTVAEAGHYDLFAWGLRSNFAMRLEDADGWPVAAPLAAGELSVDLEPGDYRLIVLPQAVPARAVVVAARAAVARELSGHGPHPLTLDSAASNLWLEPEEGASRDPDLWRFTLPAPTGVTIALSDEMMGVLRSLSSSKSSSSTLPDGGLVPPGRSFHAELLAGEYELAAESSRSNNQLRYRVELRTDDLVDGGRRVVPASGEIWLAVGGSADGAQVELASFGRSDVRATLRTALGETIASSDDRPGDWNFLIGERLAPGRYRLRVDPVGSPAAATTVTMRILRERAAQPLAATAPAARSLYEVADDAVVVPLTRPAGAEVVAVGAQAGESLGLALEERTGTSWRVRAMTSGSAGRLALPIAESTADLRLRIWSLDRRPATAEVTAFAGPLAHRSEADLARGFELEALAGVTPRLAAALVDLAEPGCFRREIPDAEAPELLQALAAGSTFERAAPTLAPVGFTMPLAAAVGEGETVRVQARRARIGEGAPLALVLPAGTPLTCDVADGGAAIVELEAMAGEPVVGFLDGRGTIGPSTAWGPSTGSRVRSAKSAGKGRAVELWNSGASSVEARLSGWLTTSATDERLAWGAGRATAAVREARLVELPAGEKDLRLTLAPGTAVLALAPANADADDDAEALVWAPVEATTETLSTRSIRLLLFGGDSTGGEVSVEVLPRSTSAASATAGGQPLSGQQRLEQRFPFMGAFRVAVTGTATGGPRRLHLRGAGAALFVGGDGRVQRGTDFEVTSAGGSLRFEHPPGLVSAWIDDGAAGDRSPSAVGDLAGTARELTLPATVDLSGASALFDVAAGGPALLKVRGTSPIAVAVGSPATRSEVYPQGAHFDAVLPAGSARIALRALAGEDLTGTVTIVAEPLESLAEGLGAESLLAPGDSRGFAFHVAHAGAIGAGVRADQGSVETLLFDSGGRLLGQGVVQWAELAVGDYVLVVAAPAEGRPARIRPALVGASPPGNGPPPEEARRFLALAAGEMPAVAGVAGAEDLPADWLGVRTTDTGNDEESYSDESYDDEATDEGEWTEESELSDDGGEAE